MNKMTVIYWSQTGNTEAMAKAIAGGARSAGAEVNLVEASEVVEADWKDCGMLALGCPAMGAEVLEESVFEPFFQDLEKELSDKRVALFGSYGWGDGQWMRDWWDRTERTGASLYGEGGLTLNGTPDQTGLETCRIFGRDFASSF